MKKEKSILTEKVLKVGDIAVLYVTSCSDVNPWMQYNRGFTECCVKSIIPSADRNGEQRYLIVCADKLRDEVLFGGLYNDEAVVSSNSPFLMTQREYERYMNDEALLEKLLDEYANVLKGGKVPKYLRSWQADTLQVMYRLGMGAEKVIADVRNDFLPGSRKELVCFAQ